jgi:G:T-mismatch repair DNA endonuclease (very short patch repair protein)
MGLPDKPCVLLEFTGTSFNYTATERNYVEKVWAARAKSLIEAMRKQGWRGLVTWSPTLDDATIKADALRSAVK